MKPEDIDDFLVWAAIGVVAGGRIGYILFYDLQRYIANPLDILAVWQGGMSFHGGFLGTTLAMILFARARGISVLDPVRRGAAGVPVALGLVRFANFINSELWGKLTDVPWAFVFPNGGPFPRHPSQLYEAGLEGLVLFLVLRMLTHRFLKLRTPGFVAGAFVAGYGLARIFVEFFREPDQQIGYLAGRLADHGHGAVAADGAGRHLGDGDGKAGGRAGPRAGMTRLQGKASSRLIEANGPISIADYMALCLFDPRGRLLHDARAVRRDGDFTTAPEISQMFGELIGVWLVGAWQAIGRPLPVSIAEIGPGRGTLMKDMLRTLDRLEPRSARSAAIRHDRDQPAAELTCRRRRSASSRRRVDWHRTHRRAARAAAD